MAVSVLHVGMDAAEPDLVEQFVADGTMPAVAAFLSEAETVPLGPGELQTGGGGALQVLDRPCPPPGRQPEDEENQWARFR